MHGRDHSARDALIALLRAFDLKVIHWRDAVGYAGGGTPYTGDIVAAGMANADAVVAACCQKLRPIFLTWLRLAISSGDGRAA